MKFQTILTPVCTQMVHLWKGKRSVNTINFWYRHTEEKDHQIGTSLNVFCLTHGLKNHTRSVLSAGTTWAIAAIAK